MKAFKPKRTTIIIAALMMFLIGIAFVRLRLSDPKILATILAIYAVSVVALRHSKSKLLLSIILAMGFSLGIVRGQYYLRRVDQNSQYFKKQITIVATAREDAVYSDRKQLIFSAGNVMVISPIRGDITGNVEIEGIGVPMVYRGDRVEVTGKLFPKRGDNVAGVSFGGVTVVKKNHSVIDKIRRNFSAGLQNTLPEPLASLALGILIGQRNTLPDDLKTQLTDVGLIHIVAVSGYNLTIIINAAQSLLKKRSRFQVVAVSSALIGLFLLLTGSSPSIVRAAVVSTISLVMWYYGRTMKPLMILLLSAVITVAVNPLYLWSSIGWYLSFTAFFGVLILAPLIRERYLSVKTREKLMPQILSETFAAQICTLPIILYIFGRLSLISIIANLLVIPTIPAAMAASLVAGLYGMVGPFLFGGILVIPARLLLQYIFGVTSILGSIPHVNIAVAVSASQMVLMYVLIAVVTTILFRVSHRKITT